MPKDSCSIYALSGAPVRDRDCRAMGGSIAIERCGHVHYDLVGAAGAVGRAAHRPPPLICVNFIHN